MKCPKCGYERTNADQAPDWQCPSCGVAYAKVRSSAPAAPVIAPRAAPAPEPVSVGATDDERLALAASGQKIAIYCILLTFVMNAGFRAQPLPALVVLLISFLLGTYSLLGVVRICSALEKSQGAKIGFMVCAFMPLASLVTLVYLSVKATKLLRSAGWTVGLLGAKP